MPWNTQYLDGIFTFTLATKSPVVLVLSQPDDRYFMGLEGRYRFDLHFRLYKEGEDTYIVRSMLGTGSGRSCSAELELEPGNYSVHIKIETGRRDDASTAEEIIKKYRQLRRDKLFAVGKNFDLPNSKGRLREKEDKNEKERKAASRKEEKDELKRQRGFKKIERERERARKGRIQAEIKKKTEAKKAERKKEREEKEAVKAAAKTENESKKEGPSSIAEQSVKAADADTAAGAERKTEETSSVAVQTENSKQETLPTPESMQSISSPSTTQPTPETDASEEKEEKKGIDEGSSSEKKEDTVKELNERPAAGGESGENEEDAKNLEPESEQEDVSDVSSVIDDDFSWDSDIDGFADVETDEEEEPGMYFNDPWNAACVIGLRVYCLDKETKVKVEEGKAA